MEQGTKIIFIGTPEYGAIVLEGLIKGGYRPVLAVTAPDKPKGRKQILTPSVVKVVAKKHNIPVEQPKIIKKRASGCRSEDGKDGKAFFDYLKFKIKNLKPDLGIVVAYGQIIPKDILDIPKFGFLNVHPSLLPKYRGPSPIQFTILNGEKKSGVTIILIDEKTDHGPIVAQRTLAIGEQETAATLHNKLAELGAGLLLETIPKWLENMIKPKKQDDSQATFTKILFKEDGKINWEKPAEEIERKVRAFNPWPGTYSFADNKIIKILKVGVLKQTKNGPFGSAGKTYLVAGNKIAVQSGHDFIIIEKLQLEGKKEMGAEDFLRGHSNFIGTILS